MRFESRGGISEQFSWVAFCVWVIAWVLLSPSAKPSLGNDWTDSYFVLLAFDMAEMKMCLVGQVVVCEGFLQWESKRVAPKVLIMLIL
jgi:hypothetical protein